MGFLENFRVGYILPPDAHTHTPVPYLVILFYVIGTTFYQKIFAIYKVMRACACVRNINKKKQMKKICFKC